MVHSLFEAMRPLNIASIKQPLTVITSTIIETYRLFCFVSLLKYFGYF